MKKRQFLLGLATAVYLMWSTPTVDAETILYVPQDNRPVSLSYTVDAAEAAGYQVITPPAQYISGRTYHGDAQRIWQWVEQHANQADIMVLSTDSLIYGGLVDSRKHHIPFLLLQDRVEQLKDLKRIFPNKPIYAFGTIMRSPRASGGGVEPPYYALFGPKIFQIAALQDKLDSQGLSKEEFAQLMGLSASVPTEYLQDWFHRRNVNMRINTELIDLVKNHTFTYFALGHDDTSKLSQSAMESRYLNKVSQGLTIQEYGSFPGADQLGLLLMARAHVDRLHLKPTFEIIYPLGGAENTNPHYEDQSVGKTIKEHIEAVGGTIIGKGRPEYLLAVNTPLTDTTGESEAFNNFAMPSPSTQRFVNHIEDALDAGIRVGVADISLSNGSDNILMHELEKRDLLYKLDAYDGWNTASNTIGYAIAQMVLSPAMSTEGHKNMLTQQYLDNWAYQANIRKIIYRMQEKIRLDNVKYTGLIPSELESYMGELVQSFAEAHLKVNPRTVSAKFPWGRLFETDITVYNQPVAPLEREIRLAREKAEAEAKAKEEAEAKAKAEAKGKGKVSSTRKDELSTPSESHQSVSKEVVEPTQEGKAPDTLGNVKEANQGSEDSLLPSDKKAEEDEYLLNQRTLTATQG